MGFTVTTNGTNPWDFVETVVNDVKKIYKTIYVHVFESFSVLQDALKGTPSCRLPTAMAVFYKR